MKNKIKNYAPRTRYSVKPNPITISTRKTPSPKIEIRNLQGKKSNSLVSNLKLPDNSRRDENLTEESRRRSTSSSSYIRHQSRSFFFIEEQIVGSPKRRVQQHERRSDRKRHHYVESRVGQEQQNDGQNRHHDQDYTVIDRTAGNDQRLVAEEIEEQPKSHEYDEDDEGDRVPEEAEEENKEHDHGVVHTEVADVDSNAGNRVREAAGEAERSEIEHELPWAASSETGFDSLLGA
ncbi:hypothetical protein QN277_024124 [Acacia crassicarpa]|uniref:Uncharacterized protein n=1 Tax=Acacia crassicarpa TaxID=499986 RepID=A0AAE1JBJ7_9FABA|nr:hypothetical protein QN277_024124 [Acacia crassicarpa]